MPVYSIKAPNGKRYDVEAPEGADDRTLFTKAKQLYEADEDARLYREYGPGVMETAWKGVKRGAGQLGSVFTDTLPALAGSALGFDDYAKEQLAEAEAKARKREAENPALFKSYKDVDGFGQAIKFGAETVGEQVANLATSIIPGVGLGAGAARMAASAAAKRLAAQAAEKGLAAQAAEQFVAQGLKAAAPKIASSTRAGQGLGVYLGSYAQTAPEIFEGVYEKTGKLEPSVALLFGAASAALDSVLPAKILERMTGPLKMGVVEKILEKSGMNRGLLRSVTAGLTTGVAGEGLTESAQEAINIAAERFVSQNYAAFSGKDWERLLESGIKGAVAGGAFGTVGGVGARIHEKAERGRQYEDLRAARQERDRANVVAQSDAEITALQQLQAEQQAATSQMQLPGVEVAGPATSLYTPPGPLPPEPELTKEQKAQKQLGLFPKGAMLSPEASQAAWDAGNTSSVIGSTKDELKALGQWFGIGPTAKILQPNGPLAGKDLNDPVQAEQVKIALEAYANSTNAAKGAADKIAAYLARPEFENIAKHKQRMADEAAMAEYAGAQPQQQLPGLELGMHTALFDPSEGGGPSGGGGAPAMPATQFEMFGPKGGVTKAGRGPQPPSAPSVGVPALPEDTREGVGPEESFGAPPPPGKREAPNKTVGIPALPEDTREGVGPEESLTAPTAGDTNAAGAINEPSRAGAAVAGRADAGTATQAPKPTKRTGVVPPAPNVGVPTAREGTAPSALDTAPSSSRALTVVPSPQRPLTVEEQAQKIGTDNAALAFDVVDAPDAIEFYSNRTKQQAGALANALTLGHVQKMAMNAFTAEVTRLRRQAAGKKKETPPAKRTGTAPSRTPATPWSGLLPADQLSLEPPASAKMTPSLSRGLRALFTKLRKGKITESKFIDDLNALQKRVEDAKLNKPLPSRVRGALFIRQRLLEAVRNGWIPEGALDMAEWFIKKNPALVDDLGVSFKAPSEDPQTSRAAGFYTNLDRIFTLVKESASETTPVHEILHHLERMMPSDVQNALRIAFAQSFAKAVKSAQNDPKLKAFYDLLTEYHWGERGSAAMLKAAMDMIGNGVGYEHYQHVNPSEFWAVNATQIMQGRFAVKDSVIGRIKQYLKEFAEKIKDIFGLRSDAPLLKALNSVMQADGKFVPGAGALQEGVTPSPFGPTPAKSTTIPNIPIIQHSLRDTDAALAQAGDFKGLLRSVIAQVKNPVIAQILRKLHSLNLNVKLVVGNPEGPLALNTPAFQRWFGSSKVVGADGRPIVVYTGTSKDTDFTKFKVPKNGVWFDANPESASQYATQNDSMGYTWESGRPVAVNTASRVMPVYLRIEKPYTLTEQERQTLFTADNYKKAQRAIFERAKAQGYDGVDFGNGVWVVIGDATQIKSAIGNIGTYDPNNPDIRYAGDKAGSYDSATNTITLDPNTGLNAHTFIHEAVHAAISHVLNNSNHPLTKSFTQFYSQIRSQLGNMYGGQDLQEFAAELVGNPEFQALLKTIKAPRSENMFERIVRAIAEFFGFPTNAFKEGAKFVNSLLDVSADVAPDPSLTLFLTNGNPAPITQIANMMPKLAGNTVENTKNYISKLSGRDLKMAALGVLSLDHLNTLFKKEMPSISRLISELEKRAGATEMRIGEILKNYKAFRKIANKHRGDVARLQDIAVDARLSSVNLLDPNFVPNKTNQAEYTRLKNAFNSLHKDVQGMYRTMRTEYDSELKKYEEILDAAAESVSASVRAKLADRFQDSRVIGYVPFMRYGDFWIEYQDPVSGERAVSAFESPRERQKFIDANLKGKQYKTYRNVSEIKYSPDGIPSGGFLADLMMGLQKANASSAQLDAVYQAYLERFPGESILKQFIKSKNTAGMERDLIRNYATIMPRWARKIANSKHLPEIDRALRDIKIEADQQNDDTVVAAADTVIAQSAFMRSPSYSALVSGATTLSYFELIAGNVSSAVVNLTSIPMMVGPILFGKFGGAAFTQLIPAGKTALQKWGETSKYKKLHDTLMEHGQLEHTMAREVLEARRNRTEDYTGIAARVMDGLSIPFSAVEKYNRAVTAIAAYDLATGRGMSDDAAIQYALETVKEAHTSGMAATSSRWMQHPLGRIFFTFKRVIWNQAFVIARSFHQSFRGEDKEIRAAAFRQLIASVGMAGTFAGASGLPFSGLASTVATMIGAMFGSDDEDDPLPMKEQMRTALGEFLYKGPVNYMLNLEIANRTGVATDLVFRDDPQGMADHGVVLSALITAAGPAGGIAANTERGIKLMSDGHIWRGFEAILPSFARNGMKGWRYMTSGATTLKGDPIDEDISAWNGVMQMAGFAPADLSTRFEVNQAERLWTKDVLKRRENLMYLYDMAYTAGDPDMLIEAYDRINKFNTAHPGHPIVAQSLRQSHKARMRAQQETVNGIRLNKKLRTEILDKFYDEED